MAERVLLLGICTTLLTSSVSRSTDQIDRVRAFTREVEFDYIQWTVQAAFLKIQQGAAGLPGYLDRIHSKQAVTDYLDLTDQIVQAEGELNKIYADAALPDKNSASAHLRAHLDRLYQRQVDLAPFAEAVLQQQVSQVAASLGLTTLGQPIPSVLYHSTAVPSGLIVSPRGRIEQTANISLLTDLTLERQMAIEDRVEKNLDLSALIVPIGGVGVYPTMIMRTTDLTWLVNTIAHEWTHNYLEFRPLGVLYDATPELRTMNETTASISGNEIGAQVIQRYYPELAGRRPGRDLTSLGGSLSHAGPAVDPTFDFRAEMHSTRVRVDDLLAGGRIDDAETYMEQKRRVFVRNGYFIRKLNQAYFAFYGAYADVPGGAAGEDPVGPAVRSLRTQSASLADFVNRIAWMTSFEQLKQSVGK